MRRVMAQGTFDIVHPGHLHYLRESARLGDELHVVISRDSRMQSRKDLFMDDESRREVVEALEMVDSARLGSEGSIFDSVQTIKPAVITIGYDQQFDLDQLADELVNAGYPDIEVTRISEYTGEGIRSSSDVKRRLRERLGPGVFHSVTDPE